MDPNVPPTPSDAARQLMVQIMRCPHIDAALDPSSDHPCRKVVGWQWPPVTEVSLEERRRRQEREHELPEPWSGDLERALILFVSSNPSAADPIKPGKSRGDKSAPRGCWDNDDLVNYYHRRFIDHIQYGHHHLVNGVRGKSVRFWSGTRGIARQLLPDAAPGREYVLTELVRCKSQDEVGVDDALKVCPDEYLARTLDLARNAQVVVALGKKARDWFSENATPSLAAKLGCVENVHIKSSPERTFTYLALGHPSSGEQKLPETVLGPDSPQLASLRARLQGARAAAAEAAGR